MKNLCINGEAITNSFHESGNIEKFGPNNAFDGSTSKGYASHSFAGSNKPYIAYHFSKPERILKMYLTQGSGNEIAEYGTNVYVIYSDDGINWIDAKYVTNLPCGFTEIQLEDNGAHEYWGLQLRENVSGINGDYPWTVVELEMYGNTSLKDAVKDAILNHELMKYVVPHTEE